MVNSPQTITVQWSLDLSLSTHAKREGAATASKQKSNKRLVIVAGSAGVLV
jgi:hypothetical protein